MKSDLWPFDQSRKCAVFTRREVLERKEPILHVTHDIDDHGWQFMGLTDGTLENTRLIALHEAVELDRSVLELADLPVGVACSAAAPRRSVGAAVHRK